MSKQADHHRVETCPNERSSSQVIGLPSPSSTRLEGVAFGGSQYVVNIRDIIRRMDVPTQDDNTVVHRQHIWQKLQCDSDKLGNLLPS